MKTFYENFIEIAKVRNYAWRRNIWNLFRYTRISTKAFIKNVLQNVLKQCDNAERSFFYLKEISRKIQTHASRLGGNSILNKKNVFFFFLHSLFHLKCFVKSVEKQTLRRKSFP